MPFIGFHSAMVIGHDVGTLYYTKTRITSIKNHLPCHLSQPTHLGTQPKTATGTDREPTIYFQEFLLLFVNTYFGESQLECLHRRDKVHFSN